MEDVVVEHRTREVSSGVYAPTTRPTPCSFASSRHSYFIKAGEATTQNEWEGTNESFVGRFNQGISQA